jgi:hypothetical protein
MTPTRTDVFEALLRCEPRLADAALSAFLRYGEEIARKNGRSRAPATRGAGRYGPAPATSRCFSLASS